MSSTADNLMMNAKVFAMSAETLVQANDMRHDISVLHLSCLSLELSFKAWVKLHGATEADLKALSHDLEKGYVACLSNGLADPSGGVGKAVRIMAPIYRKDYTRYMPDVEGFHMLSPSDLAAVAVAVAKTVETCVWPDDQSEA